MWVCPKCKHKFENKNAVHSCTTYIIGKFLKGKSEKASDLLKYFISLYKRVGAIELSEEESKFILSKKIRFCSINKVGIDYIDFHLVLGEPFNKSELCYKVENVLNIFYLHHFRIFEKEDIDKELKKYMKLAYDLGDKKVIKTKEKVES